MTDLTDRMRTCAAHLHTIEISEMLTDEKMEAIIDARKMLVEAADVLDIPLPAGRQETIAETRAKLGEPLPPLLQIPSDLPQPGSGYWIGDDLKPIPNAPRSRNACPKCDSRAGKTVKARNETIWLECAACGHAWIAR